MAKLVVLYNKPADAAAFDAHYFGKHVPLAKTIPGLRTYEVNATPVATPQGPADIHLVAMLTFDSMEAIGAAFAARALRRWGGVASPSAACRASPADRWRQPASRAA